MRLMALAIRFDGLIRAGVIRDYAGSRAARRRYQGKDDPDHEPAEPCAGHPGGDPVPSQNCGGSRSGFGPSPPTPCGCRSDGTGSGDSDGRFVRKRRWRAAFPAIGKADCHSRDITGIFLICGTQEMPCPRPHCVLDLFSGSESIVTPYRCCSPDGLCGRIVGRRQAHARPTRQTRRC